MDDDTKEKIAQVQVNNNFPSLERLVKLVISKYPIITREEVKMFLANDVITQQTKGQYKPRKPKKGEGGHMTAFKPNELWNVDIFVMLRYKRVNDGYNYFLVCVDVFTRKAWGEPMKYKDSVSAREAISTIINKYNKPRSILIDNDAGFLSSDGRVGETFSQYLEKDGIALQTNALKDHHAMGIIDNFALRLRTILAKTAIKENSVRWIGQVDKILDIYNNAPNSALGNLSPNEAGEPKNYEQILDLNVDKNKGNTSVSDLKPGDKVRTNILKNDANSKGSDPKWSGKVHTVKETIGQTITLDSDVRHKRHDLLKVPHDAEDLEDNIITKTRKENSEEARKLKTSNPAFKDKLKRLLEKKKKQRADFKAQQEKEAEEKKAKEEKDTAEKKEKEFKALLKKEQDLWNLSARTRTPTVPYPTTQEHLDDIAKRRKERLKQALIDKAAREKKVREEKAKREKIKEDNRAFKKKKV
jgi:hypothetical protein